MKNSIGNESHNDVRAVRNPQRIIRSASGGIGVPCSAAARVHAINLFCTRQTTPQVLISIINPRPPPTLDRKSTRLNSSHANISYAVFCLKKKKKTDDSCAENRK